MILKQNYNSWIGFVVIVYCWDSKSYLSVLLDVSGVCKVLCDTFWDVEFVCECKKSVSTDSEFVNLQPVDISQAVTERIKAQRLLAENPYNVHAICMLSRAQEQVQCTLLSSCPSQLTV